MARSIFRTKSLDSSPETPEWGLKRALAVSDLVVLGVGATFGVGAFIVVGEVAARHAGPAVLLSILVAGLVSLAAALCFAEFAAMTPIAGSAYSYAYAGLGELPAFILGWGQLLGSVAGTATLAIGWSSYVASLLRRLGIAIPEPVAASGLPGGFASAAAVNLSAAFVVLLASGVLVVGTRESSRAFAVLVWVRVLVSLLVFVLPALWLVQQSRLTPFIPPNTGTFGEYGASGVWVGAGLLFFLYLGAEAVATAAEEMRDPQRDVPRALVISVSITTVLYLLLTLAVIGVAGYARVGVANPFSIALDAMGTSQALAVAVELVIVVSITSAIMVLQLGLQRTTYVIARDGLLPGTLTRVHPRFRTPHVAGVTLGVASALVAGMVPLGTAVRLACLAVLTNFAVVSAGVLVLRRAAPERYRPFRLPWAGVGAPAACVGCIALAGALVVDEPVSGLALIVWVALGLVMYATYGYQRSKLRISTDGVPKAHGSQP
ncbi:MAG: APC family permease [Longimicrobiaceae bacterium]